MLAPPRTLPTGFIAPCLPTKAHTLPSGGAWLHEIKHDGFRIIARKNGAQVRLYRRPGNDLTRRFPLIVETLARLRARSCIIDGEAVACDDNGAASFELIRHQRANQSIFLYAFDLIELNGDDLRRDPLEVRKATLASIVAKARPGIWFNEHIEGDGPTVFAHACKLGLSERGDIWLSRGFSVTCVLSAFIGALTVGMLLGEPDVLMLFGAVGGVMVGAVFYFVVAWVIRLLF